MVAPNPIRDAYIATVTAVRARVQTFVSTLWGSLDGWRDADIERFAAAVVPIVLGGQRQVASLTDAYLAQLATLALGERVRPVGIPAAVATGARGVDARTVYTRPGLTVWNELSQGRPLEQAVKIAHDRAVVLAGTDLQLAKTHSAQFVIDRNDRVTGYERVPDGNACELCLLASTQRYHSGDLMPIHDRCSCDVNPIFDTEDRHVIDPDLLDRLNAGDLEEARALVADRLAVHEHGELGPVLAVKGQAFTGPDDF